MLLMLSIVAAMTSPIGDGGQDNQLVCAYPDTGGAAWAQVTQVKTGATSTLSLAVDGKVAWQFDIPTTASPVRLALTPDLDQDAYRDLRIRFEPDDDNSDPFTWIVSGQRGTPLFVIGGDAPFDPWADEIADIYGDGAVTLADLLPFGVNASRLMAGAGPAGRWAPFAVSHTRRM